jgi:CBS domain-containing protein
MKASEIMATNVVTVGADATVGEVAKLLFDKHISAVPVVGKKGELLGIVSEGDLLRRAEIGSEKRRSWWLQALTSSDTLADEFVKSHARKVADVMTSKVITAAPGTPISEIATLLEKNGIKRVPIVMAGKVVGIVSRANLIQALASTAKPNAQEAKADDAAVRERVLAQFKAQPWTKPWLVNVIVHDGGIVDLWGVVDSQAEKTAARVAVETTPGVYAVNNNIVMWSAIHSPD